MFVYAPPERGPAFYRRGGTEGLQQRIDAGELVPDYGPSRLHETAGGVIVGARRPLIAFNVNLRGDVSVAREIAAVVREKGGGFPGVRALGLDLPRAKLVQVSMNVEDWEASALHEIVARVDAEARARGAEVVGSELVGLMPAGAAAAAAGAVLRIDGFDAATRARAARGLAVAPELDSGRDRDACADGRRPLPRRRVGDRGRTAAGRRCCPTLRGTRCARRAPSSRQWHTALTSTRTA